MTRVEIDREAPVFGSAEVRIEAPILRPRPNPGRPQSGPSEWGALRQSA